MDRSCRFQTEAEGLVMRDMFDRLASRASGQPMPTGMHWCEVFYSAWEGGPHYGTWYLPIDTLMAKWVFEAQSLPNTLEILGLSQSQYDWVIGKLGSLTPSGDGIDSEIPVF